MNSHTPEFSGGLSMLELFRAETENQTLVLTNGLLELERSPATPDKFEVLMRAAHSLKGAARIINLPTAVRLAHALEDCFMAARQGQIQLGRNEVDLLLPGVDLFSHLAKGNEADLNAWEAQNQTAIDSFLASLAVLRRSLLKPVQSTEAQASSLPAPRSPSSPPQLVELHAESPHSLISQQPDPADRVLRLAAGNLNRLLALAGESLVESRWLRPFADSLQLLKRHHTNLGQQADGLRQSLPGGLMNDRAAAYLNNIVLELAQSQKFLAERIQELDLFDRRSGHLSQRLYLEVLRTRMRPFSEGVRRFPRMVRDLARGLGKEVNFEILGENTQVDRDILERLETPLAHLLRNAVDHGCESPSERKAAGKSPVCTVQLEARHSAGVLLVSVGDDGAGVHPERLRETIVRKRLLSAARARKLSEAELLEFLFFPGFTLKDTVTEISGRGFGLDVVQNMIKTVRGAIRLYNQAGKGFRVQLQLPLTLSVLRALLVEIGGEPYAIPLNQIARILKLPRTNVGFLDGRHTFSMGDNQVSLLAAHQILDCGTGKLPKGDLSVVVLGERSIKYGLVVDRFLGERELVVQPLDPRLGKVQDISAAALMENGAPVLIIDVDELIRSIEGLVAKGLVSNLQLLGLQEPAKRPKRVLAVDDSLTVRELERKLLLSRGYLADVAVDGLEAWNAVRSEQYDLVITDVDMPRLDGIELATLIKKDSLLKSMPVLIVSYKDRAEDRMRGLEAGADYYLTKGSFHDETLLQAVVDLIGEPEA
jgi:two-component system sensor histidine kinase and response regulator WspE